MSLLRRSSLRRTHGTHSTFLWGEGVYSRCVCPSTFLLLHVDAQTHSHCSNRYYNYSSFPLNFDGSQIPLEMVKKRGGLLTVGSTAHDRKQRVALPSSSYQGIKHQSIKSVTVRVLHHDVEECIQSVLQELE